MQYALEKLNIKKIQKAMINPGKKYLFMLFIIYNIGWFYEIYSKSKPKVENDIHIKNSSKENNSLTLCLESIILFRNRGI